MPEGVSANNDAAAATLAACPACLRVVSLDDDFVRLRDALYHLSCLLTALRALGEDMARASVPAAAVRDGIDALRTPR
jgi:hypothetical protein